MEYLSIKQTAEKWVSPSGAFKCSAQKTASLVRHASAAIGLSLLMQKSRMTRESRAESI